MQRPPAPRARHGPRSLVDCSSLQSLFDRTRILADLDQQLRRYLSPTLAEHVRLGNVRGDRIVFLASSAAWASRLRLEQTTVLRLARAHGIQARALIVKIVPPAAEPEPIPPARVLSAAAAAHLKAAAQGQTDPELRKQLLALASLAPH